MNKTAKPNNYILYAVCLLSAAGLLAICSKSSPLYPLNDWPDINCFYTLGKGMIHGKMPYVDLLEQKGPYIYAMAALSYLMDGHGFGGYFLFEVLGMYLFLLYAYKLSALYCRNTQLWMLPLLGMAVTTAKSFVHGGSWEQLSLGILAYAAYSLLAFLKHPGSPLGARTLVLNGLLGGGPALVQVQPAGAVYRLGAGGSGLLSAPAGMESAGQSRSALRGRHGRRHPAVAGLLWPGRRLENLA